MRQYKVIELYIRLYLMASHDLRSSFTWNKITVSSSRKILFCSKTTNHCFSTYKPYYLYIIYFFQKSRPFKTTYYGLYPFTFSGWCSFTVSSKTMDKTENADHSNSILVKAIYGCFLRKTSWQIKGYWTSNWSVSPKYPVTTGFLLGTSDTTYFFLPDTSSPGIHSKKCIVIELDNVEK